MNSNNTNESVAAFLRSEATKYPSLAPTYVKFQELYEQKFWHELTLNVDAFVTDRQQNMQGSNFVDLYNEFIRHFEIKINALKWSQIVIKIAFFTAQSGMANGFDPITFLRKITCFDEQKVVDDAAREYAKKQALKKESEKKKSKKKGSKKDDAMDTEEDNEKENLPKLTTKAAEKLGFLTSEAELYLKMKIAELEVALLNNNGSALSKDQYDMYSSSVKYALNEYGESAMKALEGADPIVHAAYYYTRCRFDLFKGQSGKFYRDALMFLAYVPSTEFLNDKEDSARVENVDVSLSDPQERRELAVQIALAALTGDDVFNFGEVLCTPILTKELASNVETQWIGEMLKIFNHGDIDGFGRLWSTAVASGSAKDMTKKTLIQHETFVKQKLEILALMNLVFHRDSNDRNISFSEISEATQVPKEGVERLIMKALSLGLIKGKIDQIHENVNVSYVQPRVLSTEELVEIKDRLGKWTQKVAETHQLVEDLTPELFQ